jgi:alpha-D-xyloside xylohydrolase
MLGESLLIAPVVVPGGQARYYLPDGKWFDLSNRTWIQGPGYFERKVPLDTIPMFGREGTLLPLGPAVQHTGELQPGLDLEQVWAFGQPRRHMQLPGLTLSVSPDGQFNNMPANVAVQWL